MDIFEILTLMDEKEIQVNKRLDSIISSNLDPFPFERINKGKALLKLMEEIRKYIETDQLLLAGMKLKELEYLGIKIVKK
ncbi:hypothetical protein [Arthrospiribacter ruber]|uniref:Uncharacterized protein n=1 Tax=Arthrospiribacter ruber TaxID=2487934 RepID=A0A951IZA3_9BACT|nr:hypothetical protein [Arthrospiribacter ruber]MBW3466811.1 hypothetical protein [Arthrospiribacter ruber]MBW3469603.1 hypothetical protein [Arthrospiribacter ruber]MBW3470322.1 hypothetical protein [Arthrospiribacter ruber]